MVFLGAILDSVESQQFGQVKALHSWQEKRTLLQPLCYSLIGFISTTATKNVKLCSSACYERKIIANLHLP